jgi:hypothetical protein
MPDLDVCPHCNGSGKDPARVTPLRRTPHGYNGARSYLINRVTGEVIRDIAQPLQWMRRNAPNVCWLQLKKVNADHNDYQAQAVFTVDRGDNTTLVALWSNWEIAQKVRRNLPIAANLHRVLDVTSGEVVVLPND